MEESEDILKEFEDSNDLDNFENGYDDNVDLNSFDNSMGDYGQDIPLNKYNDLLKDLTNFSPYLKDTVNGWLGITWNEEKQRFCKNDLIRPIMNLNCAAWCVSYLKTYTRSNNIITDIGGEEYKNMVVDIVENIWLNIGTRAEEFGIKKEGDILRICNELEHAAELVLMGAGDGKYNKFMSTITSRTENISPQNQYGNPNFNDPRLSQKQKPNTLERFKRVLLGES